MRVVDALPEHGASLLSQSLRQADVDEWVLGLGRKIDAATLSDPNTGPVQRALLDEGGACICMWGAAWGAHPSEGFLWLIATKAAECRARAIHRLWRAELEILHAHFERLGAYSYGRNILHHQWLEVLGFERLQAVLMPPFAVPFVLYARRKEPN